MNAAAWNIPGVVLLTATLSILTTADAEAQGASRKGDLPRLKRTISHPGREWFTLAANLPFPCSVTTVANDDMKFIAQQGRHD